MTEPTEKVVVSGENATAVEPQAGTEGSAVAEGERKPEPISLEELRNKMQEQQQKLSRPVFKTKEQRREEALARKEQEARAKQREREDTLEMVRQNEKRRRLDDAAREKEKQNAARAAAQAEKDSKSHKPGSKQAPKPQVSAVEQAKKKEIVAGTHLKVEELEVLKQKYLGRPVQKKQIVNPLDAKRFEWDATEDTSRDPNDLYDRPYEARLLFGRGFRAGIDTNQQVDKALDYEDAAKRHQRDVQKLTQAGRIGDVSK